MWYANKIKIPDKQYVNFQRTYHDWKTKVDVEYEKPWLGFMVPHGTDKAYEKRKLTVDRWANDNNYHWNEKQPTFGDVFENQPIEGFQLTFKIRNGYKYSPDAWRIEDPRGFILEIRSDNLAQLMRYTKIENGKIAGKCVWAREGARNVLLSVNTDEYKEAVANTVAIKAPKAKTFSIKKVSIGSWVTLDNGQKCLYLGLMHAVTNHKGEENRKNVERDEKPVHVFYIEEKTGNHIFKTLYTRKDVNVVSIDREYDLTPAEAEAYTFKLFQDKANNVQLHNYDEWSAFGFTSFDISTKYELKLLGKKKDINIRDNGDFYFYRDDKKEFVDHCYSDFGWQDWSRYLVTDLLAGKYHNLKARAWNQNYWKFGDLPDDLDCYAYVATITSSSGNTYEIDL